VKKVPGVLPSPGTGQDGSGRWYDDVRPGERFARTLTITDTHIVLGAGLIGDFNPHHVDDLYARKSRFGTRILHGMITSALMGAPVGMYFHGTAIAYVEHSVRFTAPVRAGDTLTTTWTVTGRDDKPRHRGGMVSLSGECRNQEGVTVATADAKMLVQARHPAPAAPARGRIRRRGPGRDR
jgi:acyl dehydratase